MNSKQPSSPTGNPEREQADALRAYYAQPAVRNRIVEFLGGESLARVTCEYITADDATESCRRPRAAAELWDCLDRGLEISRALWDRESLVVHLDVEYVNFDYPAEAYQNPERIFELQRPVVETILELLATLGIIPLRVLSGRGHHFVWQIGRGSGVFARLAQLGVEGPSLKAINRRPHAPFQHPVPENMSAAFAGLGRVMEFLAHRIKQSTAPHCTIPVEFTALEVGPRLRDREMISIDLSEYGDPLHTRTLRVPFSVYHKPAQLRWLIGEKAAQDLPTMLFIPLQGISVEEALQIRCDLSKAATYANLITSAIPFQEEGTEHLLTEYEASPLAQAHRWFYGQERHPPEKWAETYDRTPLDVVPRCAREILEHPNDALLHPSSMRLVSRVLLALGWHPRHISGLIWSKFARDYGWRNQWQECDPATRADFYTRIFTCLFATGGDDLIDFNCQSSKEEKICAIADCPYNLELFRQSALARRKYDKLAHQPIHRLFLPKTDS